MNKLQIAKQLIDLLPVTDDKAWIIDGGCHIGLFADAAIKQFPTSNILAFEPDPDSWKRAKQNIGSNKQIEIVNAALSTKKGQVEFFRGPLSTTNSLLPRPCNDMKPYYPDQAVLEGGYFVDAVTIDRECEKRGIKQLDLLKLDLQGGEILALNGAKALLKSGAIKVIIIEAAFVKKYQNQPLLWEIWSNLNTYGYSLYSLVEVKVGLYDSDKTSLRHGQWNQCDAIFISDSVRCVLDM